MQEGATYFFCGIGGVGMSALAQLMVAKGNTVIGSDRDASPTTELLENKGVKVLIGQRAENVPKDCDTLVFSDAVPEDHPERVAARDLGIPELSYFQLLGRVSAAYRTVAIAGTHGKTTTTGMLAKILRDAGTMPSAIVGSIVKDFGSNYLPGSSNDLIVEACEYRDHLLELSPNILVITNLEWDHTDYFPTLEAMQQTFRKAILSVPESGAIVTDPSNPNIAPLLEGISAAVVDYTKEPAYALRMPGGFNQDNARAASAAARLVMPTLTDQAIAHALMDFHGTWRRFDYKGELPGGITVYDDYAHHPTAVAETLRALKDKLAKEGKQSRIVAAFHPHLYSRTRDLIDGFARAFGDADEVIIAPIYAAREIDDGSVSAESLAGRIREEGVPAKAASTMEGVRTLIESVLQPDDTLITMGAGDIYKVADALVGSSK